MNQDINNLNNQVPTGTPVTPAAPVGINSVTPPQPVPAPTVLPTEQVTTTIPTEPINVVPEPPVQNTTLVEPQPTTIATPTPEPPVEQSNGALNIMGTQQPAPVTEPTPVGPVATSFPTEPTVNSSVNGLPNEQTITPTPTTSSIPDEPVEQEKKKVPALVIVAVIFIIIGIVYYIVVFPKLMNKGNTTTNEQTNNGENTGEVTNNWEQYASLRGDQIGTTKNMNGAFRILSDAETYWVFGDTEFTMYQSVNNLTDNYTQGTSEIKKGKAEAITAGIDETTLDTLISESNGTITEEDIYTLIMTPTKEVTNGATNTEIGQTWTQIWILKNHGTEGIEAQVINIEQPTTTYYVKVSD